MRWMQCFDSHPANWQKVTLWSGFARASISAPRLWRWAPGRLFGEAVRRVDIAHSGQTVPEALEQLEAEVKSARRGRETVLLLVHGFGASGVGGAIKAALSTELPRLARLYGFKTYSYADKERIPRDLDIDPRRLNSGSTVLVFRETQSNKELKQDFRPNFRNLRPKR